MEEQLGISGYGDRAAEVYDEFYPDDAELEPMVALLAEAAGGGRALELGVGTGRVALPLAARGVEVHGVEGSRAMAEKLRGKEGADRVQVVLGDFAQVPVDGLYTLVFVVFNTFYQLRSQEEQVRCVRNVAAHLAGEGRFVVEGFVPDLAGFVQGQATQTAWIDVDRVILEVTRHDGASQRLLRQHIVITGEGTRLYPVHLRYVWPSELDLMARLAGLELKGRWSDWRRTPFSATSQRHISVYGRP